MDSWLAEREDVQGFRLALLPRQVPVHARAAKRASTTAQTGSSATPCACFAPRDSTVTTVTRFSWRSGGPAKSASRVQDPWFTGYETNPRWLRLERSGVGMRSVSDGFALRGPEDDGPPVNVHRHLQPARSRRDHRGSIVLKIPQHDHGHGLVDSTDRVIVGAAFLRDLVEAGLSASSSVTYRSAAQTGVRQICRANAFPTVAPRSGCACCTRQKHAVSGYRRFTSLRTTTSGRTATTRRASSEQPPPEDDLGYLQI